MRYEATTMKRSINFCMGALAIFTCLLTFLAILVVSYQTALNRMEIETMRQASLVAAGLEQVQQLSEIEQYQYLEAIGNSDRSRVTWIASDGHVIYDSNYDSSQMENHLERPEVIEAMMGGTGVSSRTSSTLGLQTYYTAIQMNDGSILRVSNTTDLVTDDLQRAIPILLLIVVVVIALSIWIAYALTRRLVRPINMLSLEHPLDNNCYEEISPLLYKIHTQNEQIQNQMEKMRHQQVELEAMTSHMSEGLVVLDAQLRILSLNAAAKRLLHAGRQKLTGQSLLMLSRDQKVSQCVNDAIRGKTAEYQMQNVDGAYLQIYCNPVQVDGEVRGCIMLIMDVSERYAAEKSRREFTANVSHELKTPLTSISGYAEMISMGMARPEDIHGFAEKIRAESARLLALVNDIMQLAKLDERAPVTLQFEPVRLDTLVEQAANRLADMAEKKQVTIEIEAQPIQVSGVYKMLDEAVRNLCSNAIKYNRPGGYVRMCVEKQGDMAAISVQDNGIGIAADDQPHIFERFYRADKSHSKTIEGTGLGLSIVRHIAQLHQGTIEVNSQEDIGSTFILRLPQGTL